MWQRSKTNPSKHILFFLLECCFSLPPQAEYLIFLPILGWKYCCIILQLYDLWLFRLSDLLVYKFQLMAMVRCFSFTSAEREVNYSRHSGMSQSCFLGDKIGHAKSVGFRFVLAVWRRESRISAIYLEITSIYSLTHSRKKELLFWLARCLNRLTCATRPSEQRRL